MTAFLKLKTNNIEFQLIPVAALSEDSVTIAKVYVAAYAIDAQKCEKFIEKITENATGIDKDAIEKALKFAEISSSEVEKKLVEAEQKLSANEKLAQKIKLPVIPGVFLIKKNSIVMKQDLSVESLEMIASQNTD